MGSIQQGGQVDQHHEESKYENKQNVGLHNEYVLPVVVYSSETYGLKKADMELMSVAQRKMERTMLGITLRDHKRNIWILHQTYDITHIIDVIKKGMDGRDRLHDSKTTDGLKE